MSKRAPLIVAFVLLLLPVLYVGSYLALVVPDGDDPDATFAQIHLQPGTHYRFGGNRSAKLFWPLEQIDRRLRPEAWKWYQAGKTPWHRDKTSH